MKAWARQLTWTRVLGILCTTFLLEKIFAKFFTFNTHLNQEIFWLSSVVIALKLSIELKTSITKYLRSRQNGEDLIDQLSALLPSELIALFRLELAQQRGFISWIRRRTPLNHVDGEVFEYWKGSQYSTIFIIVLLSCMTELPFCGLLLNISIDDPVQRLHIHWLLLVSIGYTLVWLFADRYLVKSTYHVISPTGLYLTIGARFSAEVPFTAIDDARMISNAKELSESKSVWLRKNGFDPVTTIIGTPIDQPNVAVLLNSSTPLRIEKFKLKRQSVKYLLLYVDEPRRFVRAVQGYHHQKQLQ